MSRLELFRAHLRLRAQGDLFDRLVAENQRLRDDIEKLERTRARWLELRTLAAGLGLPQGEAVARFRAWVERQRVVTNRVAVAWYTHAYCGKNPAERLAYPKPGTLWMVPVEVAVGWAHTERGGRNMMLFREPVDSGCSVWGLCDVSGGG